MSHPTLTIVAGPNGSGKTTLMRHLADIGFNFPNYCNADDIAAALAGTMENPNKHAQQIVIERRSVAIECGDDFTYETVMSHESHVEAMRQAKENGFRTVLIFIATDDPLINVKRVADRVEKGGHDVPRDRIVARYKKVLAEQMPAAIAVADIAMVFDNTNGPSGDPRPVAEMHGDEVRLYSNDDLAWPQTYLYPVFELLLQKRISRTTKDRY